MTVANTTENETFWKEVAHFAYRFPFSRSKMSALAAPFNGISLILEPLTVGGAKSTDNSAMGLWADGRAHAKKQFRKDYSLSATGIHRRKG